MPTHCAQQKNLNSHLFTLSRAMLDHVASEERKYQDNRDWKSSDISGGILEEEGFFGFGVRLVASTTRITVVVASTVTSAALDVVSGAACNVGRLLTGPPVSTDQSIVRATSSEVEAHVLENIATALPHMVLNAVLSILASPSVVLRLLTPDSFSRLMHDSPVPLLLTASSTSDMTFCTAKSHDSLQDDPETDLDAIEETKSFPDTNSSFRTDRTSSLSTLSESSGATTDESEDDGCDLKEKDRKGISIVQNGGSAHDVDVAVKKNKLSILEEPSTIYYLDLSSLLQEGQCSHDIPMTKGQNDKMHVVLSNSPQHMRQLRCTLDILVRSALDLARDDSANFDNKCCPVWKPEGDTKKTLQQMHKWNFDDRINELTKTVLKWTGVLKCKKEELRLIKTRGIVNMSPLDLKNLLIDCSRGHLINKNSFGKKDVCKFPCGIGTTTIVENTMKIPFVGGEIHSVSLTHSRLIDYDPTTGGDLYVVVSKSVRHEVEKTIGLPYFSVSVLRSVGDDTRKTDLVNVAQISEVPVPRFMVNKIAFAGAVDFFVNLRNIM